MEKTERLRKNREFRYIYTKGKVYSNYLLVMYLVNNNKCYNKVGFSVSKKIGKSVIRNKVKRRLRECYRLNNDIKKGYNIVFIPRSQARDADYKDLEKAMLSLFKKSKLILDDER